MSVSSEVQRTLVKSPPELWAELSDPATLARHLGELGEIRIVATEPDRAVDWEAAAAGAAEVSGRVEIEPSGWGTRVTLSASRLVAEPEPIEAIPEPEPESAPEPEAVEVIAEVEPVPEVESGRDCVEPEPRPGFFARLFRRRRRQPTPAPAVETSPEPAAAVAIETPAPAEPIPQERASAEPASETDISAELAALEERTTAVLTGVLDRLGAAHHRPFSRS